MFNFCYYKITQVPQDGYLIRPLNGDMMEIHVGADDDLSSTLDPAVYPLGSILVDIYNKYIVFMDPDGKTVCQLEDREGTNAILNNIVVQLDPDPQRTMAQQILQDKEQERRDFEDKNSFV